MHVFFGDLRTRGATMFPWAGEQDVSQVKFYSQRVWSRRTAHESEQDLGGYTRSHLLTDGKLIVREETEPLMSVGIWEKR